MLLPEFPRRVLFGAVSILTGPGGPVLPRAAGARAAGGGFNPHRPRRAGATRGRDLVRGQKGSFNPHRPRRAGATVGRRCAVVGRLFQSSPAPEGRCYGGPPADEVAGGGFNPHRPRRAGATRKPFPFASPAPMGFQSSPAPEGRCYGRFPSAGTLPTGAIIPESPICGVAVRRSDHADLLGKPAELGVRADVEGGCFIAIFGFIHYSSRCAKSGKAGLTRQGLAFRLLFHPIS